MRQDSQVQEDVDKVPSLMHSNLQRCWRTGYAIPPMGVGRAPAAGRQKAGMDRSLQRMTRDRFQAGLSYR